MVDGKGLDSDQAFGLDLLCYRKPDQPGYYLMMLSPKRAWEDEKRIRKSITFVLDTSGSMAGHKIAQARGALKFFLDSLQEGDRFNIIPFATEAQPFFNQPVVKTAANVSSAMLRVRGIRASGSRNGWLTVKVRQSLASSENSVRGGSLR